MARGKRARMDTEVTVRSNVRYVLYLPTLGSPWVSKLTSGQVTLTASHQRFLRFSSTLRMYYNAFWTQIRDEFMNLIDTPMTYGLCVCSRMCVPLMSSHLQASFLEQRSRAMTVHHGPNNIIHPAHRWPVGTHLNSPSLSPTLLWTPFLLLSFLSPEQPLQLEHSMQSYIHGHMHGM